MSDQVAVTLEEGRSGNSERSGFWHSPEIVQLTQKVTTYVKKKKRTQFIRLNKLLIKSTNIYVYVN